MTAFTVTLCAPKAQLKTIKNALEARRNVALDKPRFEAHHDSTQHSYVVIKCDFPGDAHLLLNDGNDGIIEQLGLCGTDSVEIVSAVQSDGENDGCRPRKTGVDSAIRAWLKHLHTILGDFDVDGWTSALESTWPKRHVIYQPMLLFSQGSFAGPKWQHLFTTAGEDQIDRLWQSVAEATSVTHVAINAPIELKMPSKGDHGQEQQFSYPLNGEPNVLRSPTNLQSLWGDFGPLASASAPSPTDLEDAFWVRTMQNGIVQVWAPRYTMFSRGNVKEKARILGLRSIQQSVEQGRATGKGCAAADLYAGIGYFAFSYARAGVDKVLCWELNQWSVDGLVRGARANGWACEVFADGIDRARKDRGRANAREADSARLIVYNESNEGAVEAVGHLKGLPPIRHVNCGLLPSSRHSWRTAVELVDGVEGGWIHVHENIAVGEIHERADEIVAITQHLFEQKRQRQPRYIRQEHEPASPADMVRLEHVERVKTYAPGVMHCVLDMYIPSTRPESRTRTVPRDRAIRPLCSAATCM